MYTLPVGGAADVEVLVGGLVMVFAVQTPFSPVDIHPSGRGGLQVRKEAQKPNIFPRPPQMSPREPAHSWMARRMRICVLQIVLLCVQARLKVS